MNQPVKLPINADTVRIAAGLKPRVRIGADGSITIAGVNTETLFGPMQPIEPFAQDPKYGAIGRQFDYQTGANLQYVPRGNEQIGFAELRALAENYDLLRLVIETRKDQIEALEWTVQSKKEDGPEDAGKDVIEFLAYPDKVHAYGEWMRAILEDMFVIDAACIYPRMTNGGKLYALDYVDGSMIKPLIDATGRTPLPPSPAYQQVIKGLPSVDYSREDLIYRPRNLRTWKVYGQSPVEQIIMTVNIALRRQLFQLDYYTAGSVPDAFGGMPDTWNPQQIAEFQNWWDQKFENPTGQNSAQRRRMRWGPGAKITFAKEEILKDEYDEWLARICCYAFSVPPTPFVKQMNRATAQAQSDSAKTEGLLPLKRWWKALMDYIITVYLKRPDLEFHWRDEEELDPLVQAQIDDINIKNGSAERNEVRAERGQEPLPEDEKPLTPTTEQVLGPDGKPVAVAVPAVAPGKPAEGPGAEKLAKRIVPYIERRATMIQRQRMTRGLKRAFRAQVKQIVEQATQHLGKAAGEPTPDDWLDWGSIFGAINEAVQNPLEAVSKDAVGYGIAELPAEVSAGVAIGPGFVNDYSLEYAKARGAEMIGKKWVDGVLVDNPDARWTITDETREAINQMLGKAIQEGWTTDELQSALEDSYAFSPARAEMVARTETRLADGGGRQAAWKESGVVSQKVWLIGDDNPCQECIDNADEGPIDLEDTFPSGDDAEPAHPSCNCVVSPIVEGMES